MLFTVGKICTDNFLPTFVDNYLAFYGVPFLFSGIIMLLFVVSILDALFIFDSFFWAFLLDFPQH